MKPNSRKMSQISSMTSETGCTAPCHCRRAGMVRSRCALGACAASNSALRASRARLELLLERVDRGTGVAPRVALELREERHEFGEAPRLAPDEDVPQVVPGVERRDGGDARRRLRAQRGAGVLEFVEGHEPDGGRETGGKSDGGSGPKVALPPLESIGPAERRAPRDRSAGSR